MVRAGVNEKFVTATNAYERLAHELGTHSVEYVNFVLRKACERGVYEITLVGGYPRLTLRNRDELGARRTGAGTCLLCGGAIERPVGRRGPVRKFCSNRCRRASYRTPA